MIIKKKIGRPRVNFEFDEAGLDKIAFYAGIGMTVEHICHKLSIKPSTWYRNYKKNTKVKEKMEQGRAEIAALACGNLVNAIKNGNLTATIFYLKTRLNWKEGQNIIVENKGDNSPKTIYNFNAKDAMEASKIYQQIMLGQNVTTEGEKNTADGTSQ